MENMSDPLQIINCGPSGADRLPVAFDKVNDNFSAVDGRLTSVEGGVAVMLYSGVNPDPNGSVTPTNPALPAIYYSIAPLSIWVWDQSNTLWVAIYSP